MSERQRSPQHPLCSRLILAGSAVADSSPNIKNVMHVYSLSSLVPWSRHRVLVGIGIG